jgi:signal transduction histidine kinase
MRFYAQDGKWYTFSRNSIDYSHRIFVNGQWLLDNGRPGVTPLTDIPNTGRVTFTVQGVDGVIEIVQQSTNHVHRSGGGHSWWTVGTGTLLSDWVRAEQYQTSIMLGSFLILALLFFVLFLTHGKNIGVLFFAFFCLTWFLRMGVTGGRVFTVIFPGMSWFVKFRLEYIAIPLTAVFTLVIVNEIFKNTLPKWGLRFLYVVSAVFFVLFLVLDTVLMRDVLDILLIIYGIAIAGLLAFLYILYPIKQRKLGQPAYSPEQVIFLIGLTIFIFSAFADFGFVTDFITFVYMPLFHLTGVTILVFALCEAVAVFIASTREKQDLVVDNAALESLSRMKSKYLADMSHETKTPLAAMALHIQQAEILYKDENGQNEIITESLRRAQEIIKRVASISDSARSLASMQENRERMKLINVVSLLKDSAEDYRAVLEKQGNSLFIHAQDKLPPILGNTGELVQVMTNLLTNAGEHTKNGEIVVRGELTEKDNARFITVCVTDTGTGIDPELLLHIFKRGVTSSDGSGIGLAISKDFIENHGGAITAKSELGKGTAITFTLPAYENNEEGGGANV